jgi:hypothetical protein
MKHILTIALLVLVAWTSCGQRDTRQKESREAKQLLQGIWVDEEAETVVFKMVGDSVYYPDSTSMPAYFWVFEDTLYMGTAARYHIEKHTEHLLWIQTPTGETVKLVKSEETDDTLAFSRHPGEVLSLTEVLKIDSVVNYGGQRYHWYIAVNPTRYRVNKTSYNSEGVAVDNVYYDNIIHISLYEGAKCLFSRDFKKDMYKGEVPQAFLEQAILGNMKYSLVDSQGLHFDATLCIPDEASCYLVETIISFNGQFSLKLLEY